MVGVEQFQDSLLTNWLYIYFVPIYLKMQPCGHLTFFQGISKPLFLFPNLHEVVTWILHRHVIVSSHDRFFFRPLLPNTLLPSGTKANRPVQYLYDKHDGNKSQTKLQGVFWNLSGRETWPAGTETGSSKNGFYFIHSVDRIARLSSGPQNVTWTWQTLSGLLSFFSSFFHTKEKINQYVPEPSYMQVAGDIAWDKACWQVQSG